MDITEQSCLIPYTIAPHDEVETLNNLLKYNKKNTRIIIYGKNSNDEINPVNPMTAAKVPRNKVGRRNLRHSDLNIRIINYHLSIQRKFLPRLDVQLRVMKELFQIQKLIY